MDKFQQMTLFLMLCMIQQTHSLQKLKEYWISYYYPATPEALFKAAKNGDVAEIRRIVNAGISVNQLLQAKGLTALDTAAEHGRAEAITELVRLGADVNKKDETDFLAYSPLHWAATSGNAEAIAELVRLGADVNVRSKEGATPLFTAADGGHVAAIEKLVQLGAKLDVQDKHGHTPLDKAAFSKKPEAVLALLRLGERPGEKFLKDFQRDPEIMAAVKQYDEEVITYNKKQARNIAGAFQCHVPMQVNPISDIISEYAEEPLVFEQNNPKRRKIK